MNRIVVIKSCEQTPPMGCNTRKYYQSSVIEDKINDTWLSKVTPTDAKQIAVNLKPQTSILYEVR